MKGPITIPELPSERSTNTSYYHWRRDDILRHVPREAKAILSVGCGAGLTEEVLINGGARVTGIEMCPQAAAEARRRGLHVIEDDARNASSRIAGERFDCIIYADVLEHMAEPERLLREHVALLEPGGCVIISIPNFRHYSVFRELFVRGEIRYRDAGILDRTHLRITTRKMVTRWLRDSDLSVHAVEHRINRRPDRLVSAMLMGLAREFLARQIIAVGRLPR